MFTIKDAIDKGCLLLKDNNIENFKDECLLILEHILQKKRTFLYTYPEHVLTRKQYNTFMELINKRCTHQPLQYLLGYQEFMGLNFSVNPDVLIPRQDTEVLVETVLNNLPKSINISILDLCTGSGCISISLAHFIKNATVIGVDISKNALKTAYLNAKLNNVLDVVFFIQNDILHDFGHFLTNPLDFFNRKMPPINKFDIIVSNPPYIPLEEMKTLDVDVVNFEPNIALYGGVDGLDFYRQIINVAPEVLCEHGKLYFEVGYNQAKKVSKLMKDTFCNIKIIQDFNGIDRVVLGEKI